MRDGDPLGVWFILCSLFCHTERCTVERQWAYQIHECTMQIYSKCCKLGERDAAIHMRIVNLELSPAFSYLSILKWSLCQIGHRRASQQSQQHQHKTYVITSKGSIKQGTEPLITFEDPEDGLNARGFFMTLCKTRDVLLLESKEVRGLARWRSSFDHGHKEMILASSQRAHTSYA
ncbi:unnamed protein product [Sphagnum balticum]